jgi:hypothetical protein
MGNVMKLDIACGRHKDLGWVGIDIQALPGVDLVHDLNVHPWPIISVRWDPNSNLNVVLERRP